MEPRAVDRGATVRARSRTAASRPATRRTGSSFLETGAAYFRRYRNSGIQDPGSVHVDEESASIRRPSATVSAGEHVPATGPSRLSVDRGDARSLSWPGWASGRVTRRRTSPRRRAARTATTSQSQRDQPGGRWREGARGILRHDRGAGMGHVVDFVPNHMGIGTGNNARWNDLLENGPSSPAAIFFDVDWSPAKAELQAQAAAADSGRPVRPGSRARRAAAGVRRTGAGAALLRADAADQPARVAARVCRRGRTSRRIARSGQPASERVPQHHHFAAEPRPLHRTRSGADCGAAAGEGSGADAPGQAFGRGAGGPATPSTKPSAFNGTPGDAIELRRAPRAARGASLSPGRTGGPRRTKSTTAGSSMSTRSPGCGSRTRKCSTRRTSCSGADSRRKSAGGPDRSS